jgi:hypothetical protein
MPDDSVFFFFFEVTLRNAVVLCFQVFVMTKSQSKEDLIGSKEQLRGDRKSFVLPPEYVLSPTEKKFLLLAERGDCASVQRYV